jgi:MFS transporter, PAT family, beta-lactamase induction signal transducer AmpG
MRSAPLNPQTPSIWQMLYSRQMAICIGTGFASGLPLYFLIQLVPAWLRSEQVDLKAIGFFALIQLPYTWKFVWAPFMDRFAPPLGRRRGWMLITQLGLLACLPFFGGLDPITQIHTVAALAAMVAFLSASLDIALDAYRREILSEQELGIGNSIHVNAYRIAGLVPGSLSLILADHLPWSSVFGITALFVLPGMLMTIFISEPQNSTRQPRNLRQAVVEPFAEFFGRHGLKSALLILLFLVLYKLGDSLATALATPFYLDMGFSKTEIGLVAKNAGLWPAVIGGLLGGIWMIRLGINRALWLFGVVQVVSILGFAALAIVGHELWLLALAISFEALGVGLGTAAFTAYIARTTHPAYTATQFALFTSLAALPRTVVNAFAGVMVETLGGWLPFFILCTALALPGMLLLLWVAPWRGEDRSSGG